MGNHRFVHPDFVGAEALAQVAVQVHFVHMRSPLLVFLHYTIFFFRGTGFFRRCLKNGNMHNDEEFFARQTQFFAGILDVFQ